MDRRDFLKGLGVVAPAVVVTSVTGSGFASAATTNMRRGFLHVECGIPDVWEPDQKEIEDIMELFLEVADAKSEDVKVIATRAGVKAQFIETY